MSCLIPYIVGFAHIRLMPLNLTPRVALHKCTSQQRWEESEMAHCLGTSIISSGKIMCGILYRFIDWASELLDLVARCGILLAWGKLVILIAEPWLLSFLTFHNPKNYQEKKIARLIDKIIIPRSPTTMHIFILLPFLRDE